MRFSENHPTVETGAAPPRHLLRTLLAFALMCSIDAHAQTKLNAETWERIVALLPRPKDIPEAWPRPCLANFKELRDTRRWTFASPAVEEKYRANNADYTGLLGSWGAKYLRMPVDAKSQLCQDLPYVVARMQEAAGEEPTGTFGERDLTRLTAAIRVGAEQAAVQQATTVDAHERQWRTGVALFGIELGTVVTNMQLPNCGFDLSANRPTCLYGRPESGGVDLYFANTEQPAILNDVNVKLRLAAIPRPYATERVDSNGIAVTDSKDLRIVGLSFRTSPGAVKEFEAKFGKPGVTIKSWKNQLGATWESQHYRWIPAPDVVVGMACGVEFAGPCTAFAELNTPSSKPAPNPTARRL